jgi:hypothetical protein
MKLNPHTASAARHCLSNEIHENKEINTTFAGVPAG